MHLWENVILHPAIEHDGYFKIFLLYLFRKISEIVLRLQRKSQKGCSRMRHRSSIPFVDVELTLFSCMQCPNAWLRFAVSRSDKYLKTTERKNTKTVQQVRWFCSNDEFSAINICGHRSVVELQRSVITGHGGFACCYSHGIVEAQELAARHLLELLLNLKTTAITKLSSAASYCSYSHQYRQLTAARYKAMCTS